LKTARLLGRDWPCAAAAAGLALIVRESSGPKRRPALDEPSARQPRRARSGPGLLPESAVRGRGLVRAERTAAKLVVMAGIGLLLGALTLGARIDWMTRRLQPLQRRAQELQPITDLANRALARRVFLDRLSLKQGIPGGWLRNLAGRFPGAVRLTELALKEAGEIRMSGQAQGRGQSPEAQVSQFASWLAKAEVCSGVRLGSTQRNTWDPDLVDFLLTCRRLP